MEKRKTSGGKKVLILLIGLLVIAVLGAGVIWSIWFKRTEPVVAQVQTAKRMKVPQVPVSQKIKIPPVPTPIEEAQPSAEVEESQDTVNPVAPAVMPEPSQPQEVVKETALPTPPPVEEANDTVPLDETSADDTMAGETLVQEKAEAVPPAQESSQPPPPAFQEQTPPQQAVAAPPAIERFNLQIGAFRVEAYAQAAVSKLLEKGYAPFILEITDGRQRTWYTVRIGRYETRDEAAASLDRFKRQEKIAAVIAKAGNL